MKVLFIAPRYHTNQVPIVRGLMARGHHVSFWSSYEGKTEDHGAVTPEMLPASWLSSLMILMTKQFSHLELEDAHRKWYFASFWHLARKLIALKPDIVICRGENITTAMAKLICSALGTPRVVLYVQKPVLQERRRSSPFKRFFMPNLMMSPVLVTNPRKNTPPAIKRAFLENPNFIPLVYEAKLETRTRGYFRDDKLNILSIGKYRDYKNLFLLVEAVARLRPEDASRIAVTIVGQAASQSELDYLERLRASIASWQLGSIITLKTNLPYAQVDALYQAHDVFVLTSKREVASIAVIEAMANGLAVVSTDENGTASYVEPGISGFWFETGQADSLTEILIKLIRMDRQELAAMGQQGFAGAIANFSFVQYYQRLIALLQFP